MSDINKDDFSQIIKFKIDAESADNISQICDDLKKLNPILCDSLFLLYHAKNLNI
mgnify:FL=1